MDFYKLNDRIDHRFFQIPKELIENPKYRCLTSNDMLVYALLLDRMMLSQKNGWKNDKEEIFLLFTKEEIAEKLGISEGTVYNSFKHLEKFRLIKQKRQGLNKPNLIYIAKINPTSPKEDNSKPENLDIPTYKGNDTDNSDIKEKQELYTVANVLLNSCYSNILEVYFDSFNDHFGKPHMRIASDQVDYINQVIGDITVEKDISFERWVDIVEEHFENLPKKNNGNIFAFLKALPRYIKNYEPSI
jgi:DNA-binding Lrp family transcriptional regulator